MGWFLESLGWVMAAGGPDTDWALVAVAMDRGMRAFAELARPVLEAAGASGMSVANLVFLMGLGPGEARVSDAVRNGRYLASNASSALKALQEGGWIDRRPDAADRRVAIVRRTARGDALVASLRTACAGAGPGAPAAAEALSRFEAHCAGHVGA